MAYKTAKTLFEKANRGELKSDSPRLFSKFEFNKKAELVKPYLHYIDEKALMTSVRKYVGDYNNYSDIMNLASKYNRNIIPESLVIQMRKIFQKFPESVINDIFNIYYNEVENLEFTQRTDQNKFRYKLLEKASDPVIKVLTNHNNIKSMIFTRSLVQYHLAMLAIMEQEDPDVFDEMMKQLEGQGSDSQEGDNGEQGSGESEGLSEEGAASSNNSSGSGKRKKSIKELLDEIEKRLNGSQSGSQVIYDKMMAEAKQSSKQLDSLMTEDQQQELWQKLSDPREAREAYERTDPKYLERIKKNLDKITLNMGNIKESIKRLLNNSLSYFSAKDQITYENILEASGLDGMEDWVLMHPKLRKVFIHDINVKQTKKVGKINIYIDVSGSMDATAGTIGVDGKIISKATFSKAFTYRMKEEDLLSEVYSFQNSVQQEENSLYGILTISGGGGTKLNEVIKHAELNKKNAIVITDAEDYCDIYSPYVFFIGVAGCKFFRFKASVLKQYNDNNQIIVFDGKSIRKIDNKGNVK